MCLPAEKKQKQKNKNQKLIDTAGSQATDQARITFIYCVIHTLTLCLLCLSFYLCISPSVCVCVFHFSPSKRVLQQNSLFIGPIKSEGDSVGFGGKYILKSRIVLHFLILKASKGW